MKAKDVVIGSRVREYYRENMTVQQKQGRRTGIVVGNDLRSGDECIVIEWDDNFSIQTFNVNDVVF